MIGSEEQPILAIVRSQRDHHAFAVLASSGFSCSLSVNFTPLSLLDDPLNVFFVCSVISSACFLHGTILAVYQVVAINEMSDEAELQVFLGEIDAHQNLPGRFTAFGLVVMFAAILVYSISTVRLGLQTHQYYGGGWILVLVTIAIILYVFGFAISRMIQGVYEAKIQSVADEKRRVLGLELERSQTVAEGSVKNPMDDVRRNLEVKLGLIRLERAEQADQPNPKFEEPKPKLLINDNPTEGKKQADQIQLLHDEEREKARTRARESIKERRRRQQSVTSGQSNPMLVDQDLMETAMS
eukprot:c8117_g1_i2.p1 GENE.c8117_g1_i2~~c8117_g1_i2.p1  ORF type:complete len:298 (-),score=68.87 c8117_g1_i2:69-962(-)